MLSDRLEQWAKAYKAEGVELGMQQGVELGVEKGVQKGVQKGEALLLRRALVKRFGALPAALEARIEGASVEALERWFDRAFEARSLEEVFDDTGAGTH